MTSPIFQMLGRSLRLIIDAGEMAWREDMRRVDNGNQLRRVGMGALAFGKSRNWTGYWQRAS